MFDQYTEFPGSAALIPVLGTVFLILSCEVDSGTYVTSIFGTKAFTFLGDISYSLYLVHWPFLVIYFDVVRSSPNVLSTLGLIAALIFLSYIIYRYIEEPIRTYETSRTRILVYGSIITLSALGSVGLLRLVAMDNIQDPAQIFARDAVSDNHTYLDGLGCYVQYFESDPVNCKLGAQEGTKSIVIFGDSHAAHWVPGLDHHLQSRETTLIPAIKSACPSLSINPFDLNLGRTYHECVTWRSKVFTKIGEMNPDLVILSNAEFYAMPDIAKRSFLDGETWSTALELTLRQLKNVPKVIVLRDIPIPGFNVPKCHSRFAAGSSLVTDCRYSLKDAQLESVHSQTLASVSKFENADYVDMTSYFCNTLEKEKCKTREEGYLMYFDSNHMTATQSKTLAPALIKKLEAVDAL